LAKKTGAKNHYSFKDNSPIDKDQQQRKISWFIFQTKIQNNLFRVRLIVWSSNDSELRGHFRNAKTLKFTPEGNVGIGCASVVKWIFIRSSFVKKNKINHKMKH